MFCCDVGLWKVEVVGGFCEPKHSEADTAAAEDSQEGTESTEPEKPAEMDESRDSKDDEQMSQQQQEEDSSKDNRDNSVSPDRNESVEQHEASTELPRAPTCRLVMVLYGDQGKTQPLLLADNVAISEIKFKPGIADKFLVSSYFNV